MTIFLALDLFALVILVYFIIINFFTMLFRFTGLPEEKAKFQVMSLLTGCGFTTKESELITSFKPRRRIAYITMLFGYAFNITIVSAFINVFLSLKLSQKEDLVFAALIPALIILLIFLLMRVPKVREWENRRFERLAGKILHLSGVNTVLLIDHIGTDSIAQVSIREMPEALRDTPLEDTGLKTDQNILVMLVERGGKKAEAPDGKTVFHTGDKLTLFGDYNTICEVFQAREQFEDSD